MEIKNQPVVNPSELSIGRLDARPDTNRESHEPAPLVSEDERAIENVRERLSQEVAAVKERETFAGKTVFQKPKQKPNLATRIFDRINFPSGTDMYKTLRVGYAAIGVATLALVAKKIVFEAAMSGIIPLETGIFVTESLYNINNLSIVSMLATAAAISFTAVKEQGNKTLYGKMLTVTKVSALSGRRREGLPLSGERFLGEMHFLGKESFKNPFTFLTSSFLYNTEAQNVRQGLVDLYTLAEACSHNSPELEGINVFMGISPVLTKNPERFGFQIFPYRDHRNFIEKILDVPTDVIDYFVSIPMRSKFKAGISRPSRIGIVTREKLIENKGDIKKLIDRLGTYNC